MQVLNWLAQEFVPHGGGTCRKESIVEQDYASDARTVRFPLSIRVPVPFWKSSEGEGS
jgi:heme-binding NEAT domain protein